MLLRRTVLGYLGIVALVTGLCAPAQAQLRAGSSTTSEESDISALRAEVAELRARAEGRVQANASAVPEGMHTPAAQLDPSGQPP